MIRCSCLALLLLVAGEIQMSHSTEVKVEDDKNKLCLYADLMVNFTVTYAAIGNINNTAHFELPENVTTNGSFCGSDNSTLHLQFGIGHSWVMNFTRHNSTYMADSIIFTYNLSDATIFVNSTSNATNSVTFLPSIDAALSTYYSCRSQESLKEGEIIQTLWNVTIEAFVSNGSRSENATICAADQPTTPAPTNHTVPITTPTTPTPTPLPQPSTGTYRVKENNNTCLMITMGLQITYKDGSAFQTVNLDPNTTIIGGNCGSNTSDSFLVLTSGNNSFSFNFTEDGKKFHLRAVNVTMTTQNGTFQASNNNMSLWEAALGSSYMCNKQQAFNVTDALVLHTYNLRVQPFSLKNDTFATAHECSMDDTSVLIPIIVGAALAGLIVIVLVAYVIGRRKTYVGYQSL